MKGSTDLPREGRLMAIDAGERRVGVALCDDLQLLVTPWLVLSRRSLAEDARRLGQVVAEQRVVGLVVGHPLNADGSAGPQAHRAARYGHRVGRALELPTVLWDEYGSSQMAAQRLAEAGKKRRRGAPLDSEAAAVILQDFLEARRLQGQTPAETSGEPNRS